MQNKYVWATLSIAAIWLATALVGVFGPQLEIHGAGGEIVIIPVLAMTVGFFALVATIIIGIFGFRR
jgi:hypothetical protein